MAWICMLSEVLSVGNTFKRRLSKGLYMNLYLPIISSDIP